MNRVLIAILAILAIVPLTLGAQEDDAGERLRDAERRLEQAAREIAELSSEIAGESLQHVFKTAHHPGGGGRAMLGINVARIRIQHDDGSVDDSGVEPDGVEIHGVTPGGPAEAAGLRSGDIVLSLDGEPLGGHEQPPDKRLLQLMEEVEPGDTVRVTYRRGDAEGAADVITRGFEPGGFTFQGPGHGFTFEFDGEEMGDLPELIRRFPGFGHPGRHGVWRGLELVPLTPKLGSYFGTDSGLLVIRAPLDEAIPLEEGDVIRGIAGASPKSPPEAMRLLRFYEPGDQVVVDVIREKRNRTFKIVIPEAAGD